jgi:hypothetical protein
MGNPNQLKVAGSSDAYPNFRVDPTGKPNPQDSLVLELRIDPLLASAIIASGHDMPSPCANRGSYALIREEDARRTPLISVARALSLRAK